MTPAVWLALAVVALIAYVALFWEPPTGGPRT